MGKFLLVRLGDVGMGADECGRPTPQLVQEVAVLLLRPARALGPRAQSVAGRRIEACELADVDFDPREQRVGDVGGGDARRRPCLQVRRHEHLVGDEDAEGVQPQRVADERLIERYPL